MILNPEYFPIQTISIICPRYRMNTFDGGSIHGKNPLTGKIS